jgi:hypothetical protein
MKTISFVGSDKNAGKTTSMNHYVDSLLRSGFSPNQICMTSIGLNGELIDEYEFSQKPSILLKKGQYFVTTGRHLINNAGKYETISILVPPHVSQPFVVGKALMEFPLCLEGPNEKTDLLKLKAKLQELLELKFLLVDGSIDRQFLANPLISDSFCFSLLLSSRQQQNLKANTLLETIQFKECEKSVKLLIERYLEDNIKTLLISKNDELLHSGIQIPFTDENLKKACLKNKNKDMCLYLNGALSRTLYDFLCPFNHLTVILDNFTLYQNISTVNKNRIFKPKLQLLNAVSVDKIYINEQDSGHGIKFPEGIHCTDIYREPAL